MDEADSWDPRPTIRSPSGGLQEPSRHLGSWGSWRRAAGRKTGAGQRATAQAITQLAPCVGLRRAVYHSKCFSTMSIWITWFQYRSQNNSFFCTLLSSCPNTNVDFCFFHIHLNEAEPLQNLWNDTNFHFNITQSLPVSLVPASVV